MENRKMQKRHKRLISFVALLLTRSFQALVYPVRRLRGQFSKQVPRPSVVLEPKKSISIEELAQRVSQRKPRKSVYVPNRICYILHNSLPFSSGGYAVRAHGLSKGLQSKGFDLICVTRPGFPSDTLDNHNSETTPALNLVDGINYMNISKPGRGKISGPRYINESAAALANVFEELKPEFVMAASNYWTSLPAQIAARGLGIPFIYEVRGFWEVTRASRDPDFANTLAYQKQAQLEAVSACDADHVFTLTRRMKDELVRRGADASKITLLPNSCAPERFSPRPRDASLALKLSIPDDVPVIGYIGTFAQYEGLDDLSKACGILSQRGLDFRLLIVGSEDTSGSVRGPISQEILRISEQNNFGHKLIMPGRVPHQEVEAYYSLIDIAPFPRKPQPVTEMVSPMKPLEAFAMEKAVVVSSVAALSEMVRHGETGLIFEKGNVTALADALHRLIIDQELRVRLGSAARQWTEQERTWARTAGIAKSVFDDIGKKSGAMNSSKITH